MQKYMDATRSYMSRDFREMYRKKSGSLPFAFLTPGSASYKDVLWDWDSSFSNVALKQILLETGADPYEAVESERGCILNYLSYTGADGFMPIMIGRNSPLSKSVQRRFTRRTCTNPSSHSTPPFW